MHVSNTLIIAAVFLVPFALVVFYFLQNGQTAPLSEYISSNNVVRIERISIPVEVADTREARIQGLSGRESLPARSGLLFVFEEEGVHGIWMRDMRFPIDIIWISKDLRVVDIRENVQPQSFPKTFFPKENALYVLEVNAFFVEQNGILLGDEVNIPDKYQQL